MSDAITTLEQCIKLNFGFIRHQNSTVITPLVMTFYLDDLNPWASVKIQG